MGWEAAVIAISTALIALFIVIAGILGLVFFRDLTRVLATLDDAIKSINDDARPALKSARELVDDAGRIVATLKDEADEIAGTSRDMRRKLTGAAASIEDRLIDLDALVDVAQMELEDTVLDVAAALRTGRRSAKVLSAFKRAVTKRKRR